MKATQHEKVLDCTLGLVLLQQSMLVDGLVDPGCAHTFNEHCILYDSNILLEQYSSSAYNVLYEFPM